jgi:hypothetical protein
MLHRRKDVTWGNTYSGLVLPSDPRIVSIGKNRFFFAVLGLSLDFATLHPE